MSRRSRRSKRSKVPAAPKTCFWVSWEHPQANPAPLTAIPSPEILGFWTKERQGSLFVYVLVSTANRFEAEAAVFANWPDAEDSVKANGWKFFDHKTINYRPSESGFAPYCEWMARRMRVEF